MGPFKMRPLKPTIIYGKSNFYVEDNVSLNKANYYFGLNHGIMVAACGDKIFMGPTVKNENGEMYFSKGKTIIIPTPTLVEFVKTLCKVYEALITDSKEEFQDTIFTYKKTHHLVSKFQFWQGEYGFTLFYKCNFGKDSYYHKNVEEGG